MPNELVTYLEITMPTFSNQDSAVIMNLWEQYGQAFGVQGCRWHRGAVRARR